MTDLPERPHNGAILCFGDSLTWGHRPDRVGRHVPEDRWPVALAAALPGWDVVAEGLNGRTTAWDVPSPHELNGARLLPSLMASHAPLAAVVLMLGTNDLMLAECTAAQAARGMGRLVQIAQTHPLPCGEAPPVLVVAPPIVVQSAAGDIPDIQISRSHELGDAYRGLAEEAGVSFFDASAVVPSSPQDGCHLEAEASRALGIALAGPVRKMLTG